MRIAFLLIGPLLAGCATAIAPTESAISTPGPAATPTTAPTTRAPSTPDGAGRAWTITPLKGTWKTKAVEVTADGKIVVDGREHARFVGNDIRNNAGEILIHGSPDGEITVKHPEGSAAARTSNRAHFNERDELITGGGGHLRVDDDGAVFALHEDQPARAPLVLQGFTPSVKREVMVLFLVLVRDF